MNELRYITVVPKSRHHLMTDILRTCTDHCGPVRVDAHSVTRDIVLSTDTASMEAVEAARLGIGMLYWAESRKEEKA